MKLRKVLLSLLLILFVFLGSLVVLKSLDSRLRGNDTGTGNETKILNQVQNDGVSYSKVKQVVDGDTIKLESGETVRYIGVNTPEVYEYDNQTNKWYKIYKCYSAEAMQKNKELVEGKVIRLEKETSERDKFGRLLRDVWINGMMINLELVKEGDAKVMTVPPDKKYEQQILAAEKEARERKRGLWEACQN